VFDAGAALGAADLTTTRHPEIQVKTVLDRLVSGMG